MRTLVLAPAALLTMALSGCATARVWKPDHPDGEDQVVSTLPDQTVRVAVEPERVVVSGDRPVPFTAQFPSRPDTRRAGPVRDASLHDGMAIRTISVEVRQDAAVKVWLVTRDGRYMGAEHVTTEATLVEAQARVQAPDEFQVVNDVPAATYELLPTTGRVLLTPLAATVDVAFCFYALVGAPLWITEFACCDGLAPRRPRM